jgi:hypothetical protein
MRTKSPGGRRQEPFKACSATLHLDAAVPLIQTEHRRARQLIRQIASLQPKPLPIGRSGICTNHMMGSDYTCNPSSQPVTFQEPLTVPV